MPDKNSAGGGRRRVLLGEITTVHGIRGEVVVRTYTQDPAGIAAYGPLETEDGSRFFEIMVRRVTPKGGVIAAVRGIADRTQAEKLRGMKLYVGRDRLPEPEPGTYYHEDLAGLTAVGPDGAVIGCVVGVQNFGAGDLLEVRLDGGRDTEFYPFTDAVVPVVDIAAGRLTLVPPESIDGETAPDGEE